MLKKHLSVLLVLMMAFGLLSALPSAYAATGTGEAAETTNETTHVHTPGKAVHENVIPTSSIGTEHTPVVFDSVIYCTDCGEELSREISIDSSYLIHSHAFEPEYVPEVSPTQTENGRAAHYRCKICGDMYSDEVGIKSGGVLLYPENNLFPPFHRQLGDIDGNNRVNQKDCLIINEYLTGFLALDGGPFHPADTDDHYFEAADVDFDGRISVFDFLKMERYVLKAEYWEELK